MTESDWLWEVFMVIVGRGDLTIGIAEGKERTLKVWNNSLEIKRKYSFINGFAYIFCSLQLWGKMNEFVESCDWQ